MFKNLEPKIRTGSESSAPIALSRTNMNQCVAVLRRSSTFHTKLVGLMFSLFGLLIFSRLSLIHVVFIGNADSD